MTELMKRYEAETGKNSQTIWRGECVLSDNYIAWFDEEYKKLQSENALLKAQLTWRLVTEKPEKADMYFVECKPYTGCDSTIITTAYFNGERFLWHDVVKWLPIPPTKEM